MITRRLILNFPAKIVTKPITYRLVKDYDLQFNILRAEITADVTGKILIEIMGSKNKIEEGIKFLEGEGVSIQEASRDIIVDKEQCMDCGVCTSICITQALILDKNNYRLIFDKDKCILCGFCQNCCPVNAIKLNV
ncbi:MAG TPA: NIL domain-containing protein [Methanosarcinales archaeon]|nr:NIL domain-containing protein [Methanosarcinales archaeon]